MNNILQSVEIYKDKNCKNENMPNCIKIDIMNNIKEIMNNVKGQCNNSVTFGYRSGNYILDLIDFGGIILNISNNSNNKKPIIITSVLKDKLDIEMYYIIKNNDRIEKVKFIDLYSLVVMSEDKKEYGDYLITAYKNVMINIDNDGSGLIHAAIIYKE